MEKRGEQKKGKGRAKETFRKHGFDDEHRRDFRLFVSGFSTTCSKDKGQELEKN